MKTITVLVRLVLTILFAWAAVVKIADPRAFLDAIHSYRLVPAPLAGVIAVWLPWLELTLAIGLWKRRMAKAASGILTLLALLFTAALLQAWLRGVDITCGCFGETTIVRGADYVIYLARDLALTTGAALLWCYETKTAPDPTGAAPTD